MTTIVTIDMGGTGATHAAGAREALSVPSMTEMGAAYAQANAAYAAANAASGVGGGGYDQANAAYAQANTARTTANNAYDQANNAYDQANTARSDANTTFGTINTTFGTVNTSLGTINTNYQAAYSQANTARDTANLAYEAANNSNLKLGGLISGTLNVTQDLIVGGNIYLEGNTTYINVATYSVEDALIYLSSNNKLTDSVDIGFMGGKNSSGTYAHTGLARDATDGKWKLFDGLAEEGHVGNVVDFANTYLATLVANVEANSITVLGNAVATATNTAAAYTQANAAYGQANTARSDANTTFATVNTTFGTINTSLGTINTSYQAAYAQANTARTTANDAYGQANTARSDANTTFATINTTFGTTNTTFATINTTFGTSNTSIGNRVLKAGDTMTGQLNISSGGLLVTGNVGIGTATAGAKLQVESGEVRITSAGAINTHLNYQNGGDNYISHGNAGATYFRNSSATLMTILGSGNVGIGVSPSYKLDVSGDVNASGFFRGGITSSGNGDSNAPFRFAADYSGWASHWAGTPGSNNGWGLFWAGNSGAQYGTNGTSGPGNIWSNSDNPNEAVFVGNGTTDWTVALNSGNTWQKGSCYVAGDVYSSYSDLRLKDVISDVENALEKICQIDTIYYTPNELAKSLGAKEEKVKLGTTSQSVKKVFPELIAPSPVNVDYDTVQYDRLVVPLIAAMKEQQAIIESLKKEIDALKEKVGV